MQLGPYETGEEIGRGGMGVVFRARSAERDDLVLKLLLKSSPTALARFDRERRLLAALGAAEGFVPLLDAGTSPRGAWIVMPFIPGGTLRERIHRGPIPVEEVWRLGVALAAALGRAHSRGIVHRDVKPENVLFTVDGAPLIADLGLARHFERDVPGASASAAISKTGVFVGTAGYSPPEQMRGGEIGPPADVFALGVVLHECLTGQRPFYADSAVAVMARVEAGDFDRLGSSGRDLPFSLVNVIERSIAREPASRPRDGLALEAELRKAQTDRRRPRRRAHILAGAVALGCGAAATIILIHGGPHPPAPHGPPHDSLAPGRTPRVVEPERPPKPAPLAPAPPPAPPAISLPAAPVEAKELHSGPIRCLALAPVAGAPMGFVTTADDGAMKFWNAHGGLERSADPGAVVIRIAFSRAGHTMIYATDRELAAIRHSDTARAGPKGSKRWPLDEAFLTMHVFDFKDQVLVFGVGAGGKVSRFTWGGDDGEIIGDIATMNPELGVRAAAWSFEPEGGHSRAIYGYRNAKVTVVDIMGHAKKGTMTAEVDAVAAQAPVGRVVAGDRRGVVRVLEVRDADELAVVAELRAPSPVRHVAIAADGLLAASVHEDGTVRLLDVKAGTSRVLVPAKTLAGEVRALVFAPETSNVAIAAGSRLSCWSPAGACLWAQPR